MNNEKGAIFQLLPRKAAIKAGETPFATDSDHKVQEDEKTSKKSKEDDAMNDILDDYLQEMKRYITLNQVNVKIAGGTDKLLVVRDVTSIVMNENIMHTKRQMSKMTDTMVKGMQDRAAHAEQKLAKLDQYISN